MRSRQVVIALAVALLVVAGVVAAAWWLRSTETELPVTAATQASPPKEVEKAPLAVLPAARLETTQQDGATTAADRVSSSDPEASGSDAEDPSAQIEVVGTVIVVDEHGIEHPEEDGTLRPSVWGEEVGQWGDPVSVTAGRFRVSLPADRQLGIVEIVLGGRAARVEDAHRYDPRQERSIVVRARWLRAVTVRVIDAATRADLKEITVIGATDFRTSDCIHPGAAAGAELLLEHGISPLVLAAPGSRSFANERMQVWIGAPTYAWGRTVVDFVAGGERQVGLGPGAALEVRIEGDLPRGTGVVGSDPDDGFPRLRLRSEGGALGHHAKLLLEALPKRDGPTILEGLEPGDYSVRIEIGEHFEQPRLLGETPVTLRAGDHATVTVVVHPLPALPDPVPLAGTLYLPPAWNVERWILSLEQVEQPAGGAKRSIDLQLTQMERTATPGLFHWNAGLVPPGKYLLEDFRFEYQQTIDTGPHGRSDVEIRIGEPADAFIRVLDAGTKALLTEADGVQILWNCVRPQESSGGGLEGSTWDDASQCFVLRAPAGAIELSCFTMRFGDISPDRVILAPGRNEFTVHVQRQCGVILYLEDDVTRIAWEDEQRFRIRFDAIDVDGIGLGSGSQGDYGQYRTVTTPGRYRITVPAPSGFEPIPPFEVEIKPGEFTERTIELVRRR